MPMHGPTTDHAEILRWAKYSNARPVEIHPYLFDSQPALLHFLFGDAPVDHPEFTPISWENFFAQFDAMGLALVYEINAAGHTSRNHELLQVEKKSPNLFDGHRV